MYKLTDTLFPTSSAFDLLVCSATYWNFPTGKELSLGPFEHKTSEPAAISSSRKLLIMMMIIQLFCVYSIPIVLYKILIHFILLLILCGVDGNIPVLEVNKRLMMETFFSSRFPSFCSVCY